MDICTTRIEFDLSNEKEKRVRFDPAKHPVVIRLNSADCSHDNTSYVPLAEHSTNASFVDGDLYYFLLPDSQIEFRSESYFQKMKIQIHYLALNKVDVFRVSAPLLKNLVNYHSELRKSQEYARHLEEDVVDDLKRIAPLKGMSGYQPLIRAYIGQCLRKDMRLLEDDQIAGLVSSLKRKGVSDLVIEDALAEVAQNIRA